MKTEIFTGLKRHNQTSYTSVNCVLLPKKYFYNSVGSVRGESLISEVSLKAMVEFQDPFNNNCYV